MESKQKDVVHGYIKGNYDGLFPKEIIDVVFGFYLIMFESKILSESEEVSLFFSLKEKFKKGQERIMDIALLYRASEHEYSASAFHKLCNNKGPTLVIVQNDIDYIFGGFTNCEWKSDMSKDINKKDFLLSVKPKVKLYGMNEAKMTSITRTIWRYPGWGPLFGDGHDLWIATECNKRKNNGCNTATFDIVSKEFCGYGDNHTFLVQDYEVFSIKLELA